MPFTDPRHTLITERRPIARLHFNGKSKKYLGIFDADKNETRHLIDSLDDIYGYAVPIREAVQRYMS